MNPWDEEHWCWQDCCDWGPHSCICGNDCEPPEVEQFYRWVDAQGIRLLPWQYNYARAVFEKRYVLYESGQKMGRTFINDLLTKWEEEKEGK